MTGWRERWIAWRNARLADPAFQSWAARFPLTRAIVRRRAAESFDLVAGFVYSQILSACLESGLLDLLRERPIDAQEAASRTGLPDHVVERLFKAAASLGLMEPLNEGRHALGARGAALLGNPGIAAMVRHHHILYMDLVDPLALLKAGRGRLADFWTYQAGDPDTAASYSALMAATQPMIAEQVLGAYDLGGHRKLLDIGGGAGAFLQTVHARHPALALALFDTPAVTAKAMPPSEVEVFGGSFLTDELPRGADVMTLVRILHDHDDGDAQRLLDSVARSLPAGGVLVVAEPFAGTRGAKPMGEAYFGLYLAAMGQGRPRTCEEVVAMLEKAGFSSWRVLNTALPVICGAIAATR